MVIGRPTHRLALGLLAAGCLVFAQGAWLGLKADIAQVLLAQSWTRAIDGESASTPWPWADFRPVARLSVPSLGEHTIILSDGGSEALAFGPTLLGASARPGEPGVSVIAAHRDTHFAFLEAVRPGDLIVVEDGPEDQYIRGVTPQGEVYTIARNAASGPEGQKSEICGPCFSPDGSTLFFNVQRYPGRTFAVRGPWPGPSL